MPPMGQPPMGQPPMGQPPMGQPQMPPPPMGQPYGAPMAGGLMFPPGVVLAPVGRRIGAYFLGAVLAIVTLIIGYIIWGLIAWRKGTSPAFQVLGMRVWHPESQQRAGFGRMALRNIVGGIAVGILSWITGLISFILFLSRDDHKSLQDLIASTVVVHDPNKVLGY
jgi:uncharacterized RDD family membrane protein YckC